jgi:hypothetical protein
VSAQFGFALTARHDNEYNDSTCDTR